MIYTLCILSGRYVKKYFARPILFLESRGVHQAIDRQSPRIYSSCKAEKRVAAYATTGDNDPDRPKV